MNNGMKKIKILKLVTSYVLNEQFSKGIIVKLPEEIADFFINHEIAQELIDKKSYKTIQKPNYIDLPLLKKKTVKSQLYQEISLAQSKNIINFINLPTGFGRTVIGLLYTVYWVSKDKKNKIVIYSPIKSSLNWYYKYFSNNLELRNSEIAQITGKIQKSERVELFNEARIIFITPQILLDGFDFKDVSLIIFDECYHTIRNQTYLSIVEKYFKEALNPHLLGLSTKTERSNFLREVFITFNQ